MNIVVGLLATAMLGVTIRAAWTSLRALRCGEELLPEPPVIERRG